MLRQFIRKSILLVMLIVSTAACGIFNETHLSISHSPIIATESEQVKFIAVAPRGASPFLLDIFVNDIKVKTCTTSPCEFVGGPYPEYRDATVSFKASLQKQDCTENCSLEDGYYFFGITDENYNWSTYPYIPARTSSADIGPAREELVIHMADDYLANGFSFADFIGDVGAKIYGVFGKKELIRENLGLINFWVYTKTAQSGGCGIVHPDANIDMPWRNDDGVLHVEDLSDCAGDLTHFSAEGPSDTKAFLHESGHVIFGLADEYCGNTTYFEPTEEPNIWASEQGCRDEQVLKERDPEQCHKVCDSLDWWKIGNEVTVMQRGLLQDPWGIEGAERVLWFFNNLINPPI